MSSTPLQLLEFRMPWGVWAVGKFGDFKLSQDENPKGLDQGWILSLINKTARLILVWWLLAVKGVHCRGCSESIGKGQGGVLRGFYRSLMQEEDYSAQASALAHERLRGRCWVPTGVDLQPIAKIGITKAIDHGVFEWRLKAAHCKNGWNTAIWIRIPLLVAIGVASNIINQVIE